MGGAEREVLTRRGQEGGQHRDQAVVQAQGGAGWKARYTQWVKAPRESHDDDGDGDDSGADGGDRMMMVMVMLMVKG